MLVAYGHSWIDGDGASEGSRCLVSLAAARLGLDADNRGVGGSSSTQTAELVAARPPSGAHAVLVMTGLNDARLQGRDGDGLAVYERALEAILGAVRRGVAKAPIVAVEQPHLLDYSRHHPHDRGSDAAVDAYNGVLRRVGARHDGINVVPVPGWDAAMMLDEDTVHPNDRGHAQIAATVVDALGHH